MTTKASINHIFVPLRFLDTSNDDSGSKIPPLIHKTEQELLDQNFLEEDTEDNDVILAYSKD